MRQCQEIINSAYARQKHASQGNDADEDNELRPQLQDILGTFFGIGARVNPMWFTKRETLLWDGTISGWARPVTAEMVHLLMNAVGQPIAIVPWDDGFPGISWEAEPSMPTVWRMGSSYHPADPAVANLGPSVDDAISAVYAKRPDEIATLTTDIDPLWPHGHESLLALELAIYIAIKDRRQEDVTVLVTQRDQKLMRLLAFLEHETVGERGRAGNVTRFQQKSIVPVSSLLMGGSSVELP